MKNILSLLAILLIATFSFAQDTKKDDWIRVQSDDGEFSIEVPANYGYFYDKDGIIISEYKEFYPANEMSVFNSYIEHTLVNFESYKTDQKALEILASNDEKSASWQKSTAEMSEIQKDGYKIKQFITKNDKSYVVKQYISSKNYIYVLTTASRLGNTLPMKRFFDSLIFKPGSENDKKLKAARFPTLKRTIINYEEKPKKQKNEDKSKESSEIIQNDPAVKPFFIISQPRSSYTDEARMNGEQGVIQLRLDFSEFGQITKVSPLKALRFGLLRNALFAAVRIKYLPEEKDDKPIAVTKTVEYKFTLY